MGLRNKNKKCYSLIFAARGDALLLFLGCESVIIRVCQKARTDRLCFYSLFATKDRVARWPDADLHFWKTLKFTGLRTFSFNNPTRFYRITNKKLDRIVVCRMHHPPLFSTEKEIYICAYIYIYVCIMYIYVVFLFLGTTIEYGGENFDANDQNIWMISTTLFQMLFLQCEWLAEGKVCSSSPISHLVWKANTHKRCLGWLWRRFFIYTCSFLQEEKPPFNFQINLVSK